MKKRWMLTLQLKLIAVHQISRRSGFHCLRALQSDHSLGLLMCQCQLAECSLRGVMLKTKCPFRPLWQYSTRLTLGPETRLWRQGGHASNTVASRWHCGSSTGPIALYIQAPDARLKNHAQVPQGSFGAACSLDPEVSGRTARLPWRFAA
jgi:hypothetical protein